MVKISVIIPIYNAESFLNECLVSIQNQTFTDYEVWLIDDGSTDNSGTICDKFAAQNEQFHVIHKQNEGVSSARNTGLEKANGEWICFMDADDTVENGYLLSLFQATEHIEKETLILQGFKTISRREIIPLEFSNELYNGWKIHHIFQTRSINWIGHPFAKLYNASLIREYNIMFDKSIHYAEDAMFMLTYLSHAKGIRTIAGNYYNHFKRDNDSLSQRISSFESEYTCYQTYLSLIKILKQRFDIPEKSLLKTYNAISEFLIRRSIGSLYQKKTQKRKFERIQILKSISPEQIKFLNTYYKECSWFHKVTVFLLSNHYYYLCDLFNKGIACRFTIKKLINKYL